MKIIKQITAAFLVCALSAANLTIRVNAKDADAEFEEFCQEEFIERMESDYMTMHYGVRDYRAMGITKPERTIGDASWESFENEVENSEASLEKLHAIDKDSLSEKNQLIYETYERYLETYRDLNAMPLFESYFDPASGIIDNLLTNFTEFKFYQQEDIDDYLEVLSTVPQFIDDALEVTRRQAAEGFFLRDDQLDMTEDAIDTFTAKTEDSQLIVIFNNRIDEMEGLSEAEKTEYKNRNREIVLNSYIPSYKKAGEELEKLRGSRNYEGGTANYKNGGKEYYAALARYKTSSDESVEDMLDDCGEFLEKLVDKYIMLYMRNPNVDELYETEVTSLDTADEVLEYLQEHLDDFPEGPEVTYEYDYLDPSVANDATTAYYLAPPLDDIKHNIIKINEAGVGDDPNELYSTLSHEAFPGHLFQITWFLNTDQPTLRYSYDFIGYQEGWGMYSEWCAWDFSDIDPDAAELNRIYIALSYVEDAAVDLAVNGLGWSIEEVGAWLESIGMNSDSAEPIADFVIQRPGLLLPYGIGMMNFLNLRWEAEEELGAKFDLKKFHTVLMEGGDRPFEFVEKDVETYIRTGEVPSYTEEAKEPEVPELTAVPEPEVEIEEPIGWDMEEPDFDMHETSSGTSPIPWVGAGFFGLVAVVAALNLYNRKKRGPFA